MSTGNPGVCSSSNSQDCVGKDSLFGFFTSKIIKVKYLFSKMALGRPFKE